MVCLQSVEVLSNDFPTLEDTKVSNFCEQKPEESPFIGKLSSSTLLWCCLFFNFTQFVV